jgi:hypothetical protein
MNQKFEIGDLRFQRKRTRVSIVDDKGKSQRAVSHLRRWVEMTHEAPSTVIETTDHEREIGYLRFQTKTAGYVPLQRASLCR